MRWRVRTRPQLQRLSLACVGCTIGFFAWGLSGVSATEPLPAPAKKQIDFVQDIQPILKAHCIDCHGAELQEAGLRLDVRSAAMAGGDSGQTILIKDSAHSPLIAAVAGSDPDNISAMPPDSDPLTDKQIGLLRAWIDQGAVWPDAVAGSERIASDHWAYQPLRRPDVPHVDSDWQRNEIDAFVLAELKRHDATPAPAADRTTLLRRLYLDLVGLPPTAQAADDFLADESPAAYEKVVDRLLESPHFGERWGRHWLDKAHYADSDGYEKDRPRPDAWRWRDWVIRAINDDMPFDEFTVKQLAGDLLPDATDEDRLATAFYRQSLTNTEGGVDQEEFRVEATFDRLETTGTIWLGLTLVCARCHSHKYDQISQREYYRLFAFMNNLNDVNDTVFRSSTERQEYLARKTAYDAHHQKLRAQLEAQRERVRPRLPELEQMLRQQSRGASAAAAEFAIVSASGPQGVTLQTLEDGSLLVSGKSPDKVKYTIDVRVPDSTVQGLIHGVRLETLPHDSLPKNGPGRAPNGNFVLSEIRASLIAEDDSQQQKHQQNQTPRTLSFQSAEADFAQKDFAPEGALTARERTGWAVSPQMGQPHQLTVWFQTPLRRQQRRQDSALIRIELDQQYGGTHTLGRFRLSPVMSPPENIAEILAQDASERTAEQQATLLDYLAAGDPDYADAVVRLERHAGQAPQPPTMSVRVVSERSDPRRTHVFRRGDFQQPMNPVTPGTLNVLHEFQQRERGSGDRLDLARWIVSDENPLMPRVVANQIWSNLFGQGLVRTLNDFGVRGERPTHPRLLDWLATEFRRTDWSRKALIRTIVMSATYRQTSQQRPELSQRDPLNLWLHRQNRFREDAEIIRDLALSAAGLLSDKIGGQSVFPPMPPDVAALSYANNFRWNTSEGADRYRRGMYTFFKRTAPHPNLIAFDCPDSNTACVDRRASNTPLQALVTLNNEVFLEAAQGLGRRTVQAGGNDTERLVRAFRWCVSRSPRDAELEQLLSLLETARGWYSSHRDEATTLVGKFGTDDVDVVESAAWITVARVLLNMDEFLTRE